MTTENICSDELLDVLEQNRSRARFNSNIQGRVQLISPYRTYGTNSNGIITSTPTQHSKHDLDQRRKAEILKYSKNGGQQSRRQAFAGISRSTRQTVNTSSTNVVNNVLTNCTVGPKPLSASNVPKDRHNPSVQTLVLDSTVPLYNYIIGTEPFPSDTREPDTFYRFHKEQNSTVDYVFVFDTLLNNLATTTYSMSTEVLLGYLEFNDLVDTEISTIQIDLDAYVQFEDISINAVNNAGNRLRYAITFPPIDQQVKPMHLFFSNRNVDSTITYNFTSYTPSTLTISAEEVHRQFDGSFINDVPVKIQTTLDIPSVNGYVYGIKASFQTVTINPQFTNSTKFNLRVNPKDLNVTVIS